LTLEDPTSKQFKNKNNKINERINTKGRFWKVKEGVETRAFGASINRANVWTVKGEKRERKKGKNSRLEKNLTNLLSLSSH
jgi:uncharacterized protein (DUF2147 family)